MYVIHPPPSEISVKDKYCYIVFDDVDSLKAAVFIFLRSRFDHYQAGARAVEAARTPRETELFGRTLMTDKERDEALELQTQDFMRYLLRFGSWRGPFEGVPCWSPKGGDHFNTKTVKISAFRTKDGKFYLHVPEELMESLVETVDRAVVYQRARIEKTYPAEGERFAIPMEDIRAAYEATGTVFRPDMLLQRLNHDDMYLPTFDIVAKRPQSLVQRLWSIFKGASETPAEIRIQLHGTNPKKYVSGELVPACRDPEFRIEDDMLTGPCEKFVAPGDAGYDYASPYSPPKLIISIKDTGMMFPKLGEYVQRALRASIPSSDSASAAPSLER